MTSTKTQVLLIEDNEDHFALTSELLFGSNVELSWAKSLSDGIERLNSQKYEVVLLDLGLTDSAGISTLESLRSAVHDLPAVILLTGNDDDDLAQEALRKGAQDYFVKGSANREMLLRSVRYAIDRYSAEVQLRKTNRELLILNEDLKVARDEAVESNKHKSRFVANMSHELRTPIAAMLGIMELITGKSDPDSEELLSLAKDAGQHLLLIVDDLLNFAKIEGGHSKIDSVPFDPKATVNSVVNYLTTSARKKNLTLVAEIEPEIPAVVGDSRKIKQILLNLVGNAIKFTNQGGIQVQVSLGDYIDDSVTVQFVVTDTGIGISPEERKHLFEPFSQVDGTETRRYGGTGLGLSISKSFVEMLGGKISFSSIKGKGSSFWFHVPFVVTAASEIKPAHDETNIEISSIFSGDVLVVEDHKALQELIKRQMTELGFTADLVDDGKAAVQAVWNHQYKLILMDLQLPRLDGYQATRRIRDIETTLGRRTPIIAVTASASEKDRQQCIDCGMDDLLTKPVSTEVFAHVIARFVRASSTLVQLPESQTESE